MGLVRKGYWNQRSKHRNGGLELENLGPNCQAHRALDVVSCSKDELG